MLAEGALPGHQRGNFMPLQVVDLQGHFHDHLPNLWGHWVRTSPDFPRLGDLTVPMIVPMIVPITEGSVMASFEVRGAGVRAIVRVPGAGKLSATFDTHREAQEWAAQQERKKSTGALKSGSGSRVTVGELFEVYNDVVASKTDSARWNGYRLDKLVLDPLASLRVDRVITHDINDWIARRGVGVKSSTVNRELNLISAAFTYAVKDRRWIDVNPCRGARRPEHARPRNRPLLTPDEVEAICIATGYTAGPLCTLTARVGACFLLALETGMRSGEILRIRPIDYWKDKRTIHVAAREAGGRKGSRSGRVSLDPSRNVPLTSKALDLLDQLLEASLPDQPYLVGLTDGQRDSLWRRAVRLAGLEDRHFHDTKHEAATRLAGFLDVLALSHAIGTKDVRLLRDTYYNNDASRSAALLPEQLAPVKKTPPRRGKTPPQGA